MYPIKTASDFQPAIQQFIFEHISSDIDEIDYVINALENILQKYKNDKLQNDSELDD